MSDPQRQTESSAHGDLRERAEQVDRWLRAHGVHKKADAVRDLLAEIDRLRGQQARESYQQRVRAWVLDCFGPAIANDMTERSFRFLEEALELVQAVGCAREQAERLVSYVYSRPAGEQGQEVGGVLVTLAALTSAAGVAMDEAGERELARVLQPDVTAKIRRKQAAKRGVVSHAAEAALPGEWQEPLPASPRT